MRLSTDLVNPQLEKLLERYAGKRKPLTVNFRRLLPTLKSAERFTHLIHPYPAKLLQHIPYFFLRNTLLSSPGDIVLDPFCGSGTVLLEASLAGRRAVGSDTNPLAALVSRVKTARIDPIRLEEWLQKLTRAGSRGPDSFQLNLPAFLDWDYWFHPHVQRQLGHLRARIEEIPDLRIREFFLVCFSACVRRVSLADPRLSVPVRLRADQYRAGHWLREKTESRLRRLKRINVIDVFSTVAEQNIKRMASYFKDSAEHGTATAKRQDARCLEISDASVQLVITSPPYLGAQKYARASSLQLGWLGLIGERGFHSLKSETIGREHFQKHELCEENLTKIAPSARSIIKSAARKNPLRAHIASQYLIEISQAISEISRVLVPGGYCVLVIGNNHLCGQQFRTQTFISDIAATHDLSICAKLVDAIRSRGLMTKRNRTADIIAREWVLVLRKLRRG